MNPTALVAALTLAAAAPGARPPQPAYPTAVVELFTSQGCSSCPPANANVAALADRPGVLALSFGVTYWDQLGWKDSFAQPAFTERQRDYEPGLRRSGPFTPQVVVDGRADVVGVRRGEIEGLIARERISGGPRLSLTGSQLRVGAGSAPRGGAVIWLVRYDPRTVQVSVARGENSGRTLPHRNVVRQLVRLGAWSGAPLDLRLPLAAPGLKTAVLVQVDRGPILAALSA